MGKTDLITKEYFRDSKRYADLWNVVIYGGETIIKPDSLTPVDTTSLSLTQFGNKQVTNDNVMQWRDKYLRVLVQENQNYIDYRMVIRNMLTESIMYDNQYKELVRLHKENQDLNDGEFLTGISKNDKFTPVITLVVNLSNKKWDAATELHSLLDIGDDPAIKNMITNYRLNLFDYHDYDSFDEFQTELRQVFSFLRYSNDETGMKEIIERDKSGYEEMDIESAELLEVLTKTKGKKNGGTVNMCKAFEDHYKSGKRDGIELGIANLVSSVKRLTNRMDDAVDSIMIEYGKDREEAERTVRKYWYY